MLNKFFWPAFFWTVLITVLCLISFSGFKEVDAFELPYKDKYVHFTFYFVFTGLWYMYFKSKNNRTAKQVRLQVFMMAVCYGIFIEACQGLFTTARTADVYDALANSAGSATAVLLLWLLKKNKKN